MGVRVGLTPPHQTIRRGDQRRARRIHHALGRFVTVRAALPRRTWGRRRFPRYVHVNINGELGVPRVDGRGGGPAGRRRAAGAGRAHCWRRGRARTGPTGQASKASRRASGAPRSRAQRSPCAGLGWRRAPASTLSSSQRAGRGRAARTSPRRRCRSRDRRARHPTCARTRRASSTPGCGLPAASCSTSQPRLRSAGRRRPFDDLVEVALGRASYSISRSLRRRGQTSLARASNGAPRGCESTGGGARVVRPGRST